MFEWDENKNKNNQKKHGANFEDAEKVFLGKTVSFDDDRADYGERRWITMGPLEGRIMVIVHTQRNDINRIISMRKANDREQEIYKKRLKETGRDEE